jgi:hypothetical protein
MINSEGFRIDDYDIFRYFSQNKLGEIEEREGKPQVRVMSPCRDPRVKKNDC